MSTFNQIVGLGHSGLQASSNLLALASFNIANADTPGFSRRVADLSAQIFGLGLDSGNPRAIRNPLLQHAVVSTLGQLGYHEGQLDGLNLIQEAFNDLDGVGLSSSLSAFEESLANLSANPAGLPERQAVLSAGTALSAAFASTRSQIQDGVDTTTAQAQATADKVTLLAQQVSQLNDKIKGLSEQGLDSDTLVDQRDQAINELGSLIDVQTVPQADGSVLLFSGGGRALVSGQGSMTVEVSDVGPPPDYAVDVTFTNPDGQELAPLGALGGELGGLIAAQNETIGPSLQALDEMAFHYVSAFNAQHAVGFDLSSQPGGAFFEQPATIAGAAQNMALDDAIASDPTRIAAATLAADVPGDNSNLLALKQVGSQPGVLPNGDSVRNFLDGLVFKIAEATQAANTGVAVEGATVTQLQNVLLSEVSVSTDEELLALTRANQAFQAATEVVQQAQTMSDAVLSLVT